MITPIDRESVKAALEAATPGPWWTAAKYSGSEMGCAIIAARTDCGPLPGNPTRGMVAWASAVLNTQARECEANARLIATAPDLATAYLAQADRIEELDQACAKWAEVSQSNYQRAKAAEAKLAKVVEALDEAWFMLTVPHLNYEPEPEEPGLRRIKTTLAELKERTSGLRPLMSGAKK